MKKTATEFDQWNERKKQIDCQKKHIHDLRIGELWRYYEGMNVWNEQSKWKSSDFRRLGIIISKKPWNGLVYLLPMTTKYNPKYSRFQMEIADFKKYGLPVGSAIIINQIKIVSKSRLIHKKETTRPLSKSFLKLVTEKALRFLR